VTHREEIVDRRVEQVEHRLEIEPSRICPRSLPRRRITFVASRRGASQRARISCANRAKRADSQASWYAPGASRDVRRWYVLEVHGHWFGSLPFSSMYQLLQPVCQTVVLSAARSSRSNLSAASRRTSIVRARLR